MEKVLKSRVKIRFQDCDPFNHLNNSKYIDYFINSREDQLLEYYNLDVFKKAHTTGETWVVASNQIQYINPVSTGEMIIIESQLNDFSNSSLLVEMKMWNENETILKSIIWIRFVHFNIKTQKMCYHSSGLMDLFVSIVHSVDEKFFETRCMEIIKCQKNRDHA